MFKSLAIVNTDPTGNDPDPTGDDPDPTGDDPDPTEDLHPNLKKKTRNRTRANNKYIFFYT